MELRVIDSATFATVDIVDSYISCIWHVEWAGFGDFELVVPYSAKNRALFAVGRIIYRAEDSTVEDGIITAHNAMFIEQVDVGYTSDLGYTMTITGRGVKSILCKRIVWNQVNFNDELFGVVLGTLVDENFINPEIENREIPGINLPMAVIGIPSITAQLYGENIGDWIDEQARAQNFGWEITISGIDAGDGPAYNIDFLTGNDLTGSVIFSPEYGNLLSVDFTESTVNYKNVALVGGEGEGTSQIKTAVSIGNKVGMGRHEIYVNGVSRSTNGGSIPLATYRKMLQQYGVTELIKSTKTMTASGAIDVNGVFKIGVDYNLGDKVKVALDASLEGAAVLTDILYSHDSNGPVTVGTFNDWEVLNDGD